MGKIDEARGFLDKVGMPRAQQTDMCCYVLLALAGVTDASKWREATNGWMRIHDMIRFCNAEYGTTYAENSRETFRKQALHRFRSAALVEDNGKVTNSPEYMYRLTDETMEVIRSMGTRLFPSRLKSFTERHERLIDMYASKRTIAMMPVKINGSDYKFSPGKHNELQKAVIEEFAPRFAPGAACVYVGDTTERDMVKDEEKLRELGFEITSHGKMPDVVMYREDKRWVYFVEAVTSHGPMNPNRILEIEEMTKNVSAGKIYVTAFLDFKTYKKFSGELAWETEVWIAETPDHMIHMNGDKFIGPKPV